MCLVVNMYNIYEYHRFLQVNFKLQTLYSLLTAKFPLLLLTHQHTDCCSLYNIGVIITWGQALCTIVALHTSILAKYVALIQGKHFYVYHIPAYRPERQRGIITQ
jgi:hypothetical protein